MRRFTLLSLIVVLILVWVAPVQADELKDAQKKKNQIDSKLNSIAKQKQQVQQNKKKIETDKKNIISTQNEQDKQYQQLLSELQQVEKELNDLDDSVKDAEDNYNDKKELFKNRLKVMYENSSSNSYLEALIESESITDFFGRLELMSLISKSDKQLVQSLATAKQDLEFKLKAKEEVMQTKQDQASSKRKTLDQLKLSRAQLEERLAKSKVELEKLDKQEDQLLQQSEDIAKQIKNLQKKGTKYSGTMIWPSTSSRAITSPFGTRWHPVLKKYKTHTSIDIGASNGSSILAANKGTVIFAGWNSAYGNMIIIDHGGGISTLYAHSSKLLVSTGDTVKAGDVIAKVGSTGLSTGPHLHFEVRVNGNPVNPLQYVSP